MQQNAEDKFEQISKMFRDLHELERKMALVSKDWQNMNVYDDDAKTTASEYQADFDKLNSRYQEIKLKIVNVCGLSA